MISILWTGSNDSFKRSDLKKYLWGFCIFFWSLKALVLVYCITAWKRILVWINMRLSDNFHFWVTNPFYVLTKAASCTDLQVMTAWLYLKVYGQITIPNFTTIKAHHIPKFHGLWEAFSIWRVYLIYRLCLQWDKSLTNFISVFAYCHHHAFAPWYRQ